MKKTSLYKITLLFILLSVCGASELFAQIKIGNNPRTINANAVLEMESNNKGLLLPRLALSSTTAAAPLSAFVQGMLVFNTATQNDVTPGVYFCDGTKWVKANGGTGSTNAWSLTGNSGTTAANNFIGTTDNAPLLIKTKNTERMRITENGWVGIGTANPTAALQIKGQLVIDSISAGNSSTDNFLVANPANGRVKMIPAGSIMTGVKKSLEVVAINGQTIFNTPAPITDINKISLYRNGVMISFSINNSNSIIAELPAVSGDEIRIVQIF